MAKQHIVVRGGLFGDEGKGATVAYLANRYNAGLVVRDTGGANAGHTVVRKDRVAHTFHQFGSATFDGIKTYLAPHFRLAPFYLVPEAAHLVQLGVTRPYDNLMVDARCLVTTPYHMASSKQNAAIHQRGTTGSGVGETYRQLEKRPQSVIYAADLRDKALLREKLTDQAAYYAEVATGDILLASMSRPVEEIADFMNRVADCVQIVNQTDWLRMRAEIETIVYEGSQGYWLDREKGMKPYVTSSDVTFNNAHELIEDDGNFIKVLALRMYACRHGVGTFPSEEPMLSCELPERHNQTHPYQGVFRRGWFDLDLVKQAITGLGGVDCISMGHLDYFNMLPEWKIREAGDTYQTFNTADGLDAYLAYISQALETDICILGYGSRKEDRNGLLSI